MARSCSAAGAVRVLVAWVDGLGGAGVWKGGMNSRGEWSEQFSEEMEKEKYLRDNAG